MKILKFKRFWTVADTFKYSDYLFIFGDNDIKAGIGGQAVIRNQCNAIGIPTKKLPRSTNNAFYTDMEYDINIAKIDKAIENILYVIQDQKSHYKGIIISQDGIGTGLAKLPILAPKTYVYLQKSLENLFSQVRKL